MAVTHCVYVVSDLHLGGRVATEFSPSFRMMTHPDVLADFIHAIARKKTDATIELVINGDFLDFLAEESAPNVWKAFRDVPTEARTAFEAIASRSDDGVVFDSLAKFLDAGHRLTILLGNHDIELAWPEVRLALEHRLRKAQKNPAAFNLRYLYDGEALVFGDVLIEHGNRYDPVNFVDHGRLRKVREHRSRGQYEESRDAFYPPVGSRLVAELMNPIKIDYPFIDLLKPESEPLFALLLALAPDLKGKLGVLAGLLTKLPNPIGRPPADPGFRQRVAAVSAKAGVTMSDEERALTETICLAVEPGARTNVVAALSQVVPLGAGVRRGQVASMMDRTAALWGLLKLLTSDGTKEVEDRIPLVQLAVRAIRGDQTFDEKVETGKRYLAAAEALSSGSNLGGGTEHSPRFRYVVFGHTHHCKKLPLKSGATYVNTGTWANLMSFPDKLLSDDKAIALEALKNFVQSIQMGTYTTMFKPTYARILLDASQKAVEVELFTFASEQAHAV